MKSVAAAGDAAFCGNSLTTCCGVCLVAGHASVAERLGVGQVRSGEVGCRRMVCLDGGHASVAERLHARYWHGDVHGVPVSSVHRHDVPRGRRVSTAAIHSHCIYTAVTVLSS